MSFTFTPENMQQYEFLLPRYPHKKSLILPCLWMAQYQDGYVSVDAMNYLSELLELPLAHLYGVASFYTMFNLDPSPKYHIQVCKTLSCELCGKADILNTIEQTIGIKVNESNTHFKLTEVECLGACGGAPMLSLNETFHENLTPEKTKVLLEGLIP